jgi:hypothetical protein
MVAFQHYSLIKARVVLLNTLDIVSRSPAGSKSVKVIFLFSTGVFLAARKIYRTTSKKYSSLNKYNSKVHKIHALGNVKKEQKYVLRAQKHHLIETADIAIEPNTGRYICELAFYMLYLNSF